MMGRTPIGISNDFPTSYSTMGCWSPKDKAPSRINMEPDPAIEPGPQCAGREHISNVDCNLFGSYVGRVLRGNEHIGHSDRCVSFVEHRDLGFCIGANPLGLARLPVLGESLR